MDSPKFLYNQNKIIENDKAVKIEVINLNILRLVLLEKGLHLSIMAKVIACPPVWLMYVLYSSSGILTLFS